MYSIKNVIFYGFLSWLIPFIIAVPLTKMSIGVYYAQIGLRYFVILIFSLAFGLLLKSRTATGSTGDW